MKLVIDALYEQHLVVGHIVRDVSPKKMMESFWPHKPKLKPTN
jgi:hypothetical protein